MKPGTSLWKAVVPKYCFMCTISFSAGSIFFLTASAESEFGNYPAGLGPQTAAASLALVLERFESAAVGKMA